MALNLDNSNAITFFISLLKALYDNVFTQFIIPGLGVSYWHFVIASAVVGVLVTALIASVRIGSAVSSNARSYASRMAVEKYKRERVLDSKKKDASPSIQSQKASSSFGSGDHGSFSRRMQQKR